MKLGQEEKALELLAKMEADDNKPIVSVAEEKEQDLPDNIDVPDVAVAPNKFSEGGKANSDDDENHVKVR